MVWSSIQGVNKLTRQIRGELHICYSDTAKIIKRDQRLSRRMNRMEDVLGQIDLHFQRAASYCVIDNLLPYIVIETNKTQL